MTSWVKRVSRGLGLGVILAASFAVAVGAATPDGLALYVGSLKPATPYYATVRVDMPTGTANLETLNTGSELYLRSPQAWPMMGEHGMMGLPAGSVFRRDADTLVSPALLAKNYVFRVREGDTLLGRPVYRVDLIPRWEGAIRRSVLLDRDTFVALTLEDRDHEGRLVQRQEVTRIDFNPDLGRFATEAPRPGQGFPERYVDLDEAAGLLGFHLAVPRYLPPGFSFYGVMISPVHPSVAHLVFTDGVTIVSLFERAVPWWARFGGGLARRSEHGYSVTRGGLAHYLVGDVPPVELQRILQSL